MKNSFVYIIANDRNGTIYIGVTNNLTKRVWEHKNKMTPGFTNKHNVNKLVYYEIFEDINYAIKREKRLKEWPRKWKLDLIEKDNPQWRDLYDKIYC